MGITLCEMARLNGHISVTTENYLFRAELGGLLCIGRVGLEG